MLAPSGPFARHDGPPFHTLRPLIPGPAAPGQRHTARHQHASGGYAPVPWGRCGGDAQVRVSWSRFVGVWVRIRTAATAAGMAGSSATATNQAVSGGFQMSETMVTTRIRPT